MLKNKFGMTKVLVIVLSVLMLVSLVACNKADGPSTDDMNAAIQAAIDAANAEQAAKEAALAASIAADKAAQEAKDAAVAESLAKEKAENDAALKKAQEEAAAAKKAADEAAKKAADEAAAAKKAADEAAKKAAEEVAAAKKAAEQAADAAAKKAAEEAAAKAQEEAAAAIKAAEEAAAKAQSEAAAALKAAEEAAAKAQAEADRVAAELAAELAAAKAAAEKAAEEAAKAQAEASKAKEEAEKAKEEAANVSSKLDETTVVPPVETTVAPETTTAAPETTTAAPETTTAAPETTVAPETTTEAPVVPVDKTDVYVAYSKLKTEYTYTNQNLYNAAEYAELIMLFDKASLDLNNAATVEAANAVLETLKVDAAAVRSVKIAAAEVAALVNALGDIETEVFSTQAEKITEAQKAYTALKKEYAKYFKDAKTDKITTDDAVATKLLSINVADLNKAAVKATILKDYAVATLQNEMKTLYKAYEGKLNRFDAEQPVAGVADAIENAYYAYLVISIVNGGDLTDAYLPIDWEYEIGDDGKVVLTKATDTDPWGELYASAGLKKYNAKKPTEFFTTEQLMETFILPTLELEFTEYLMDETDGLFTKFENGMTGLVAALNDANDIIVLNAKDVDTDDVVDALEAELEAMSFVNDYKGTATLEDAIADANIVAIKAYIEAMNVYLDVAKAAAIEAETDRVKALIETLNDNIDATKDDISETESATKIERLNNTVAKYEAEIDELNAELDAYIENVEAAALLTFEEMLNEELNTTKTYKDKWIDITDFDQTDADLSVEGAKTTVQKITGFLHLVLEKTIAANFASEISADVDFGDETEEELAELVEYLVKDLTLLRDRVSPYEEDEADADIFNLCLNPDETDESKLKYLRGTAESYMGTYYYTNTPLFEEVVEIIDTAIAAIEAETADKYENTDEKLPYYDSASKKYYFKNAAAQAYAIENELTLEEIIADTSLWTTTANDFALTYVYTAAEKAAQAAATLYLDAFKAVNAKLVTLDPVSANYRKQISNEGKSGVTATAYDNLLKTVSGDLKKEMEAVATTSLNSISSAVTTFKNQFTSDKEWKVSHFFVINDKLNAVHVDTNNDSTKDTYVISDLVQIIIPKDGSGNVIYPAQDYNVLGYEGNLASAVSTFNTRFWINPTQTKDADNSKVYSLWTMKLNMISKIKGELKLDGETVAGAGYDDIKDYMNKYEALTGTDAGKYGVTAAAKTQYAYVSGDDVLGDATDGIQILNKHQAAIDYEAALDQLVEDYTAKIMAVKISSGRLTIKDGNNKAVGNWTGSTTSGSEGDQVNYSLANAQSALDAYYTALFGNANQYAVPNNNPGHDGYANGNSEIFKAYNTHILGNTYGYSVSTVTPIAE